MAAGDRIIGRGDTEFCNIVRRIVEAGGIPIIKPKHGPIKWYEQHRVLVIPWGVKEEVPGGFVIDLSDDMIRTIIEAPRGMKTKAVMQKCRI